MPIYYITNKRTGYIKIMRANNKKQFLNHIKEFTDYKDIKITDIKISKIFKNQTKAVQNEKCKSIL